MEEKERYIIDRFDEDIFDTKKEYYPSNQTICEIINKQDKEIKKLEEYNNKYPYHYSEEYMKNNRKLEAENQQLKQQLLTFANRISDQNEEILELHNLPKKIVGEIKEQLFNHFNVKNIEEYEKLPLIDSLFTADVVFEILDQIEKGEI